MVIELSERRSSPRVHAQRTRIGRRNGSSAMGVKGGGWWDILLRLYYKFTAKSVGERIMKIGEYLAKLEAKNIVALFPNIVY